MLSLLGLPSYLSSPVLPPSPLGGVRARRALCCRIEYEWKRAEPQRRQANSIPMARSGGMTVTEGEWGRLRRMRHGGGGAFRSFFFCLSFFSIGDSASSLPMLSDKSSVAFDGLCRVDVDDSKCTSPACGDACRLPCPVFCPEEEGAPAPPAPPPAAAPPPPPPPSVDQSRAAMRRFSCKRSW